MPHVQSYKLLMPGPGGSLYTEREQLSLAAAPRHPAADRQVMYTSA